MITGGTSPQFSAWSKEIVWVLTTDVCTFLKTIIHHCCYFVRLFPGYWVGQQKPLRKWNRYLHQLWRSCAQVSTQSRCWSGIVLLRLDRSLQIVCFPPFVITTYSPLAGWSVWTIQKVHWKIPNFVRNSLGEFLRNIWLTLRYARGKSCLLNYWRVWKWLVKSLSVSQSKKLASKEASKQSGSVLADHPTND